MGVLQTFERRLGGFVEGAFARVFKGDVQPAEIAHALQREADDRKSVLGQGRVHTPNDYVVELSTRDYARVEEWTEPLGNELADMVREHAAKEGYSFVGPVSVVFERHDNLNTGVFRIRSASVPGQNVASAPTTTGPRPAPAGSLPSRPRMIVSLDGDDSAYFLTKPVTVIGRAPDSDLRIDDPGVSRRHAELRYSGGEVDVVDLGSTNGLTVNGRPAGQATLRDGDRLDIAKTSLIFRRDED